MTHEHHTVLENHLHNLTVISDEARAHGIRGHLQHLDAAMAEINRQLDNADPPENLPADQRDGWRQAMEFNAQQRRQRRAAQMTTGVAASPLETSMQQGFKATYRSPLG